MSDFIITPESRPEDTAWLGLGDVSNLQIANPMTARAKWDIDNPGLHELRLMKNPDYVYLACKVLMGIELMPFQTAIIHVLWRYKFPMFVACRGGGKSYLLAIYSILKCLLYPETKVVVAGAAFRQSKIIFEYMESIWYKSDILRSVCDKNSGPKRAVDRCVMNINGSTATAIPIGTGDKIRGMRANCIICDEFSCCGENTIIETNNGLYKIKDLIGNSNVMLFNRDGVLEKPESFIVTPKTDVYEIITKHGYSFKCSSIHKVMTNNGWKIAKDLTKSDYLVFENKYKFPEKLVGVNGFILDERIAELFGLLISEGSITSKNYFGFSTTDKDKALWYMERYSDFNPKIYTRESYVDKRGWTTKKLYTINIHNTKLRKTFYDLGLSFCSVYKKEIPWSVLQSPKNIVIAFLKGLWYGDGTAFVFKNRNKNNFGAAYYTVSKNLIDQLHILLWKLGYLSNKQSRRTKLSDKDNWMIRLNGYYALDFVKEINEKKFNLIINKGNFVVNKRDKPGYFYDNNRKDYTVAIYHNGKTKKCGYYKTEKEAKEVANKNLDELNFCLKVKSITKLPEQEVLYDFYLPETHSFVGNGFIQHNSIPAQIYETVISGFAAVEASPSEGVKSEGKRQYLKDAGMWNKEREEHFQDKEGNQSIISGTAYYDFNHFADYWKRYKRIIESRGDRQKLLEFMKDEDIDNFNWKDYAVVRLPYELIPKGFMADHIIARAKATMHYGSYNCEYAACQDKDTMVITDVGAKRIVDINVGDNVLTHMGRFKPVIKKTFRRYNNNIVNLETFGCKYKTLTTPNHPFYINKEWVELYDVVNYTELSTLKELNNNTEVDITDYCTDFIIPYDKTVCSPIVSKRRYNQEDIDLILNWDGELKVLADKYNVSIQNIYNTKCNLRKNTKYCIDRKIKLDYDFGIICGYYLSEGSVGAKCRQVSFSLDGHVDKTLEFFIQQLQDSILKCFPKIRKVHKYAKKNNCVNVTINNRLIAQFLSAIMPGNCYSKYIKPEILYSNKDFLMGLIVGYWNGDGHQSDERESVSASSCSLSLITQIRIILSYFGINSSIYKRPSGIMKIRNEYCKTNVSYNLTLHQQNARKFKNLFYGKNLEVKNNGNHIRGGDVLQFDINKKELVPYNDFVYNLEVQDDNSYSLLNATVHNCFSSDSNGFFKRSLIESCVTSDNKPIETSLGNRVWFDPMIKGNPGKKYVYGIDPAIGSANQDLSSDNFSIVVLELNEDHTRVVYCWSTNRQEFRKRLQSGTLQENQFYAFCSRKIRDLMKVFPCEHIAMDAQGGGVLMYESLNDENNMKAGEQKIWETIDENKEKDTDLKSGLHILELCQFSKYEWLREANYGMHKDFNDKLLLFPRFDSISLGLSVEEDNVRLEEFEKQNPGKNIVLLDTFEDCVMEIEELKDELCTIIITVTGTGINARERWDTPELKLPGGKKGALRKDRYSALLMANAAARKIQRVEPVQEYRVVGGRIGNVGTGKSDGNLYTGPDWYVNGIRNSMIGVIRR